MDYLRDTNLDLKRHHVASSLHLLLNHEEDLLHSMIYAREGCYSTNPQDQLRLTAAQDLWKGTSHFKLDQLLHEVDQENFLYFLQFFIYYRQIPIELVCKLVDSLQELLPS